MSPRRSRYLSRGRTPSDAMSRIQKCPACVSSFPIVITQSTTSAFSTIRGSIPGTRWTPSMTIDQPSSSDRSIAAWTPTRTWRVCSRNPWRSGSTSSSCAVGSARAGVEARVVDRGQELGREQRAHGLAHEVRRRHARDPEAVRDLGSDSRLARAGGAADQDDQRHVELVELLVAPKAAHRKRARPARRAPRSPAPPSARSRPSRLPVAARSCSTRRATSYARRRRRARCASGLSPSGPSSTDARRCRGGADRSGGARASARTGSGRAVSASARSSSSRSGWPSIGITSLSANTTGMPRSAAPVRRRRSQPP